MTIVLLLLISVAGACATAYALPRGGRLAKAAAIGGALGLAVAAILAAAGAGPGPGITPADPSLVQGAAWGGALLPGSYLRLTVTLVAVMGVFVAGTAWLLGGLTAMAGLLPSLYAAVAGITVCLAAGDPVISAAGAAGTGLIAVPLVLAGTRPGRTLSALRELRASIVTAGLVAAAAVVGGVVMRMVFADPAAAASASGGPMAAAVGIAMIGISVAVGVRTGAVPFHLRLARLADVTSPIALPIAAAWVPLPIAAAALLVADGVLAPLALPVGAEQAIIVTLALVGLGGAALAAFIADDLRHTTAYLIAADSALVVLGLAALDPATWGPARSWLIVVLVSKTALGAWGAVVEDRFGTRAVPDLVGWARRAPVLGVALALIALATYGLPGWVAFEARDALPRLAADAPWSTLLLVAGFLTLPTYLRLLLSGVREPLGLVGRAAPERFRHHIESLLRTTGRNAVGLGGAVASRVGQTKPGEPRARHEAPALPVEIASATTASTSAVASATAVDGSVDPTAGGLFPTPRLPRTSTSSAATRRLPTVVAAAESAGGPEGGPEGGFAPPEDDAVFASDLTAAGTGDGAGGLAPGSGGAIPVRSRSVASATGRAQQAMSPGVAGLRAAAERGRQAMPSAEGLRRGRTEMLSTAVLVLAILSTLVAFGAFDVAHAAAEAGPGVVTGAEGN